MFAGRPVVYSLDEASKAGEARRAARAMAGRLGFDEAGCERVAIVVTEVATNLFKHARSGELIIQGLERGGAVGLEVLAMDRGPGMADVDRCMTDGFSTAGTPGNGLGAIGRLSTLFDVHSSPDGGTVAVARLWIGATANLPGAGGLEFGVVNLPLAGEGACGDAWAVEERPGRSLIVLADGLGHGIQAAEAANEAVDCFRGRGSDDPEQVLKAAHERLRKTRGAAMAVAAIDRGRGEVRFAGVGNISGVILSPREDRSVTMVSHNGIVGHSVRKVQEFTYPWDPDSLLVLHSDGLATQWHVNRYPGLVARHPSVIAGILYRDFRRQRDDVTVLVAAGGGTAER